MAKSSIKQKRTYKSKSVKITKKTNRKTGLVKSIIEVLKPKKRTKR